MIVNAAEAKVALGLTNITDLDRAIIELLLPKADAAVIQEIGYDPQYQQYVGKWYPRVEMMNAGAMEGVWDTTAKTAFFGTISRSNILQLAELPVRSVSEVKVDYVGGFGQKSNSFGDDRIWELGTQWYQDLIDQGKNMTGHLFAIAGWPREPGTVKITYAAGYTEDELLGRATQGPVAGDVPINASAIKQAALLAVVKFFKTFKAQASHTLAGITAGPITGERLGDYSYTADAALVSYMSGMQVNLPSESKQWLAPFKHYGVSAL